MLLGSGSSKWPRNGHALETPFLIEIAAAVSAGGNELEIDVTNTWKNRRIDDKLIDVSHRSTWLLFEKARSPASSLDPAGVIGPVELLMIA